MAEISQKLGFDAASAISTLAALQKSLGGVNRQIRAMNKLTASPMTGFTGGLKQAQAQAAATESNLRRTSDQFRKTGQSGKKAGQDITLSWETMVRVVTTQVLVRALNTLITQFGATADAAHDFQLEVARITTIAPQGDISSLSKELRELAIELGRPVPEVTAAAYDALQNDLGSTAETMSVLRGAAQDLALVTGSELTDSVNAVSSVMKAYGLDASQAADITDTFFVAIDKGRITLDEISNKLGTVLPLAASLGLKFDETAAAAAALTTSGLDSSTAFTQFRNVLQKLFKPTKDLQAAYEQLGVATGSELLERFGGLSGALDALRDAANGDEQAVARMFGTIRGQLGVLNFLANEGGELNRVLEAMEGRAGRAADAVSLIDGTDAREADRQLARVNDALLAIGQTTQRLRTAGLIAFQILVPDFGDFLENISEIEEARKAAVQRAKKLAEEQHRQEIALAKQALADRRDIINDELNARQSAFTEFTKIAAQFENRAGNAIAIFAGARKQAIKQIEEAIKDIDSRIDDATDNIVEAVQELEDFKFEQSLRGLSEQEEVTRRILRAQESLNEARRAFATAGTDEAQQAHARELQEIAERQAAEALTAAERTENERAIGDAARLTESALEQRIQGEKRLREDLANFRREDALSAKKEVEDRFAEEERLLRKQLELRKQLQDPGTRPEERSQILQDLEKTQAKLQDLLAKDFDVDLFQSLGVQDFVDRTTLNLVNALDNADVQWTVALQSLRDQIGQSEFDAVVNLVAESRGLDGDTAGADRNQGLNALRGEIKAAQQAVNEFLSTGLAGGADAPFLDGVAQEFQTFAAGVRELFGEVGAQAEVLRNIDPFFGTAESLSQISQQAATANAQQLEQQKQLLALAARRFETAKQENELTNQQDQAFQGAFNAVQEMIAARQRELELAKQAPEAAAQTEQALENTAAKARETSGALGEGMTSAANQAGTAVSGIQQPINSIDTGPAIAQMAALEAAARQALAAASAAAAGAGGTPAYHGRHFAEGGGARGADTIPAMLSPGEFVVNAQSARKFFPQIQAMNAGQRPQHREEGGSVTTVGDINVNITTDSTRGIDAREMGRQLRREVRRGTLNL